VSVAALVGLDDGSRIVAVTAEGRAAAGSGPSVIRRLVLLVRIDASDHRHRVRGSWRERF
jgi:hypothetical protein